MKALLLVAFVAMLSVSCVHRPSIGNVVEATKEFVEAGVDLVEVYQEIKEDEKFVLAKQDLAQAVGFLRASIEQIKAHNYKLAYSNAGQAKGLVERAWAALKTDPQHLDEVKKIEGIVEDIVDGLTALGFKLPSILKPVELGL